MPRVAGCPYRTPIIGSVRPKARPGESCWGNSRLLEVGTMQRRVARGGYATILVTTVLWAGLFVAPAGPAFAADRLAALDCRQVKLDGEIGRRIDLTVRENLLKLDVDADFLKPFQEKASTGGFVGLGMLIDATARLAAYTGDPEVIALKQHLVAATIRTQQPDGYIGMMVPASRMWKLWDLSEMAYIVYGLTSDYRLFQTQDSLAAARKLADYVVARWADEPQGDPTGGGVTMEMACV